MKLRKLSMEEMQSIARDCAKSECSRSQILSSEAQRYVKCYTETYSKIMDEFENYTSMVEREG